LDVVVIAVKTLLKGLAKELFPLILPFIVLILVPYVIQRDFEIPLTKSQGLWPLFQFVIGLALMLAGLWGFVWTASLFIRIGKGTLAPWDPTKRLVVTGSYAHVRNPMITSVIIVLLGEALFFGSWPILVWALIAFFINHIYFIFSEEPGLSRRFGDEYEVYKNNVPRWMPRLKPWRPD